MVRCLGPGSLIWGIPAQTPLTSQERTRHYSACTQSYTIVHQAPFFRSLLGSGGVHAYRRASDRSDQQATTWTKPNAYGGAALRMRLKARIKNSPTLFSLAVPFVRALLVLRLARAYLTSLLRWLVFSREHTNYTYHLTEHNRRDLAHFISALLGTPVDEVRGYLDEIIGDSSMSEHIVKRTAASPHKFGADKEARYGRRIGWYAIIRILKPAVVIESGVDKGLGTCVLAAALLRNEQEKSPGKLYGLDIDPQAGWLLAPPYDRVAELIISDSHASLGEMREAVGVFIHDSYHAYHHEAEEYELVRDLMVPGGIVISDNAHAGTALMDFAEANGLRYHFWHESPARHFYRGAGIGIVVTGKDAAA